MLELSARTLPRSSVCIVLCDVDVDGFPVFSGRLLSGNELKAMAISEAVHSRARLQEQCYRLCDGKLVEADIFCKLGSMKDCWPSIV